MRINGGLIWGDDDGLEVYASAISQGLRIAFRFCRKPTNRPSIPLHIVNCHHDAPCRPNDAFADRAEMRKAAWSLIGSVWDKCAHHPALDMPDSFVEIYEHAGGRTQWRLVHEGAHEQYTEPLLWSIDRLLKIQTEAPIAHETVDESDLIYFEGSGGRGDSALVRRTNNSDPLDVSKGIGLPTYLETPAHTAPRISTCYHDIQLLRLLPRHSNIISPASIFVTVRRVKISKEQLVCGTSTPF